MRETRSKWLKAGLNNNENRYDATTAKSKWLYLGLLDAANTARFANPRG
jgi:hypothetical protein